MSERTHERAYDRSSASARLCKLSFCPYLHVWLVELSCCNSSSLVFFLISQIMVSPVPCRAAVYLPEPDAEPQALYAPEPDPEPQQIQEPELEPEEEDAWERWSQVESEEDSWERWSQVPDSAEGGEQYQDEFTEEDFEYLRQFMAGE